MTGPMKRERWLVAACAFAALLLGAATRLAVSGRYKPATWLALAAMVVFGAGLAVAAIRLETGADHADACQSRPHARARRSTMSIGTRSVLFGVHQFALHPILIALGWWRAYGWTSVQIPYRRAIDAWAEHENPETRALGLTFTQLLPPTRTSLFDPRLWLAFFVHDLGYLGKPNMDGPEGETHPELGARIMRRLFGDEWGDFVLLHSRYYAKRLGRPLSPLCLADKWVILLEPSWLYLPRARASGELDEFLDVGQKRAMQTDVMMNEEERAGFLRRDPHVWHRTVKAYMRRWIAEHADGRADSWTGVRHS